MHIKTVLAKKFLWFLSLKTKRHLSHFHQECYWTTYSPFCSTTSCHFPGNVTFPISQNQYFLSKEPFQVTFSFPENWHFFHLREFCKDWNNGNLKVQCLVNIVDESELPSQDVTVFAWSSKKQGPVLPWWKITCFLLTNSGCFLFKCCFQLV